MKPMFRIKSINRFGRRMLILFLVTIALITISALLADEGLAIGIAPARKILDFEPGVHKEIKLRILNQNHEDMRILLISEGELSKYITISQNIIELSRNEGEKEISYSINMPAAIDAPGEHYAKITAMQIPAEMDLKSIGDQLNRVVVAAAVQSTLVVNVPYPGKYAEAKLFISEANSGEDITFTVSMLNFGKEDIQSAKAEISILGANNQEITRIETNEVFIKAKDSSKIIGVWKAAVNSGPYHAIAYVDYDGKKIRLEKDFSVGNVDIEIKKIEVSDFRLGEIAKFRIFLGNRWGESLSNVFGRVKIKSKEGHLISEFDSASIEIPAYADKELVAYWDTKDVPVGVYELELSINYAGKTKELIRDISVSIDSITTNVMPTALAVSKHKQQAGSSNTLLFALIFVLIVVNIGWFVYMLKAKKLKK